MEYIIKKGSHKGKAHIWLGLDTACGLSDIYSLARYEITQTARGRGVCDYCTNNEHIPYPSVKTKTGKSYVVKKTQLNIPKDKHVATSKDWSYKKSSKIKRIKNDGFLLSFEWKKLRMEALKKYGSKCMCCGATPKTGAVINVDHILPRKIHPELSLDMDNLQILCHDCNHGKGNWDTTDWRNK